MIFITESIFALRVKFMSTKTNVKLYNLISSLVCVLYGMEKRSVRTFDKYTNQMTSTSMTLNNFVTYIGIQMY